MASTNTTSDSVTSSGIVTGDDPIHHALLLLIVQIALIIALSRLIAVLLRPLKQPRVVAEILGGILLGPTAFGYIPGFTENIFPASSLSVLDTVAEFGLIFFLFLVGLELDIYKIRKSGSMAMWMAGAGIILPFGLGAIVSFIIYKTMLVQPNSNFGAFTLFIGVALSITAFPVLARILAERKLLTSEVGQAAMSAAALNDVVAWVLLALAVAITNSGSSPLVALWVLLLGIAFLVFMFLLVSPVTYALAHYQEPIPEPVVAITLVLVLCAAFLTDLIGIHVIFGAFVCGLIIPKDGPFAGLLIEKVEDYVSILFLPLYFASSGLKTYLSAISNGTGVLILAMVIATACLGKVLGTFCVAKVWGMESRKAAALGFLMNTKGLVELIVLNIGLSKGVINEELFAIMVIMAIVTTFMTTPIVMWLYKPARDTPPYLRRSMDSGDKTDKLRLLMCSAGSWNVQGMINLIEATRGRDQKSLRAFVLHLIEYTDRLSSVRMSSFSRRETKKYWQAGNTELDTVEVAFQTYARLSTVKVKTVIAISAYHSMHIDICNTACENRANFLVLPFHMRHRHDGSLETVHSGLKHVNTKILQDPPCSVGLFVDKGFGGQTSIKFPLHICMLFFGGPDDREALMLASRMSQHNGIKLTVIHFVIQGFGRQQEYLNIHEVPGKTLLSHRGPRPAAQRGIKTVKFVYHRVFEFFKAPWSARKIVNIEQSSRGNDSSSQGRTEGAEEDSNKGKTTEVVRVEVDKVESQNENKLDIEALAPLLATTRANVTKVPYRAANDVPSGIDEVLGTTDPELGSDSNCRDMVILRVCKTQDPCKSVLDITSSSSYGLIITGMHLHAHSPVLQSGSFPNNKEYGLGPLGNLLVSREPKDMPASLLVIKQHNLFQSLPSTSNNLESVFEEVEMVSSRSSGPRRLSTESDVDASIASDEKGDYNSEEGHSRSARDRCMSALNDLGESLASP